MLRVRHEQLSIHPQEDYCPHQFDTPCSGGCCHREEGDYSIGYSIGLFTGKGNIHTVTHRATQRKKTRLRLHNT